MIRYVLIGFLGAHFFWSVVLLGYFWWMSRDPKPRSNMLPFRKVAR